MPSPIAALRFLLLTSFASPAVAAAQVPPQGPGRLTEVGAEAQRRAAEEMEEAKKGNRSPARMSRGSGETDDAAEEALGVAALAEEMQKAFAAGDTDRGMELMNQLTAAQGQMHEQLMSGMGNAMSGVAFTEMEAIACAQSGNCKGRVQTPKLKVTAPEKKAARQAKQTERKNARSKSAATNQSPDDDLLTPLTAEGLRRAEMERLIGLASRERARKVGEEELLTPLVPHIREDGSLSSLGRELLEEGRQLDAKRRAAAQQTDDGEDLLTPLTPVAQPTQPTGAQRQRAAADKKEAARLRELGITSEQAAADRRLVERNFREAERQAEWEERAMEDERKAQAQRAEEATRDFLTQPAGNAKGPEKLSPQPY